jgi:ParB family chromosome partitioning protein
MALDLSALDDLLVDQAARRHVPATAPPQAFEEDPAQPRFEFDEDDEFDALVEDIGRRGVLQPLVVRRLPSGVLRIRFGARRFRAAVRAGLARIPYVETEDERQFDDYAQVAENERRRSLQPLELARFVARKLAAGERKKAIAARLHIDASAITHLLALADDPPPLLLELYHSRRCRAPYYLYQLRRLMRRDAALVEHCVAAAEEIDRGLIEEMTRRLLLRAEALRALAPDAALDAAPGADAMIPASARSVAATAGACGTKGKSRGQAGAPRLFGEHGGRALELLLQRIPDTEDRVWVRFDDGGERGQVAVAEIRLSAICHLQEGRCDECSIKK